MKRREVLLNCLGGASMALAGWPQAASGTAGGVRSSPDFGYLMEEVRAACDTGWSRTDFGYPVPYLDRAWAELPPNAGSSVRAAILEQRGKLLRMVRDAECTLSVHRAAVEREPFNWEPRYFLAFTLKRAGQNEDALKEYRAVSQTAGCPHDCLIDIGWCYYRKGLYEDARTCLERAKPTDDLPFGHLSDFMMALENKMLVYGQLGLREQAEEAAKEYVRRYGRICFPERRALAKIGIDADAIYLDHFSLKVWAGEDCF